MASTDKSITFIELIYSFGLLVAIAMAVPVPARGQTPEASHASAQLETAHDHFHGGSDVSFKMTLNEPLPGGARFDVRLSPIAVDQELTVSSGESTNKERTEFILKTKLPEKAVPGEWHIKVVWLFLAGASWTNNALATNADFRFVVEGPKIEIPTKATAALVSGDR